MTVALDAMAAHKGLRVTVEDGHNRERGRGRRGQYLPAADWFFVALRKVPKTRKGPGSRRPGRSRWLVQIKAKLFEESLA